MLVTTIFFFSHNVFRRFFHPKGELLALSKLKAFSDDVLNVAQTFLG